MNPKPFSNLFPSVQQARLRAIATTVLRRFREVRCTQVAGSLAFTTLLSLVPLLTLALVVFSQFPEAERFGVALRVFLLENLLPDKAGKVIANYALLFSQKAANLTVLGVVLLLATAAMLMLTIDKVINQIWAVRIYRPLATRLAAYWVALSLGPVLLAGAIFASSAVLSLSLGLVNEPRWLQAVLWRALPFGVLTLIFAGVYFLVPNRKVRRSDALIGGAVAAFGFIVMQRLFGIYLAHFPTYTLVYGAFATIPIFLLWLYLSWMVVLIGALVAASIPLSDPGRTVLPLFHGRSFYSALLVLWEFASAQARADLLSSDQLAQAARIDHEEVERLLADFRQAGWIVRTEEGDWLLACRLESISVSDVCVRFGLGVPSPGVVGDRGERALRDRLERLVDDSIEAMDVPVTALFEPAA